MLCANCFKIDINEEDFYAGKIYCESCIKRKQELMKRKKK